MARLIFLLPFLFLSCGPSKEEQKLHEDSIRVATEKAAAERFQKMEILKDSIKFTESAIEAVSNLIMIRKADLEASRDKLITVKQPKFLRTPDEREQQVRNQVLVIEKLEKEVIALAYKIERDKNLVEALRRKIVALQ